MSTVKIDGRHVSAARDLLKITQEELADAAGVSRQSIVNLETNTTATRESTITKVRDALERRGIEFSNGDNPGIRLFPNKAIIPI